MPFIGNQPAESYSAFQKQDFSTSATTSYTLDNPVANANELALFINFVRQEPTTAYSASGTSLTLTSATASSDDMYCVYLGKAVQTVNPPNASVGTSQLVDGAVTSAKLASGVGVRKTTLAYNNSTRTVYSSSSVTVSGQNFEHPTNAAQTISFTKDNANSIIVINYNINVGEFTQQHCGLLWSTGDSIYRHLAFDGSRSLGSTGSMMLSGSQYISGLSAGSKTYYITLGRQDDSAGVAWVLNPNSTDEADRSETPTSQVIVYEIGA